MLIQRIFYLFIHILTDFRNKIEKINLFFFLLQTYPCWARAQELYIEVYLNKHQGWGVIPDSMLNQVVNEKHTS